MFNLNNKLFGKTGQEIDPLQRIAKESMEWMLRETTENSTKLSKQWLEQRSRSREIWTDVASCSLDETIHRSDAVVFPELDRLARFLALKDRGIVISTIHMGDYLHSILALIRRIPRRKVLIVRRKQDSTLERLLFGKLSQLEVDYEVVRLDRSAGMKLLRSLRAGGIAVMMYDLPRRFGQTSCVRVAGKQLHWVKGPVVQAALSGSYVLPLITHYEPSGLSRCDLLAMEHPNVTQDTSSDIYDGIVQTLAKKAEHYVLNYPTQWLHWNLVPEMLSEQNTNLEHRV